MTANNTSNNDTTCNYIESSLHSNGIYSFDLDQHQLPCLAHVVNLTITNFMNVVTKIGHVKTTTAIWEFDPAPPQNRVLRDSLDIVVTIRTLWATYLLFQMPSKGMWNGPSTEDPSSQQHSVGHGRWDAGAFI
ncbi:hypothetical protein JVT61DRAFT_7862 [Boletus reticuloceps]|uniref:Uncharacterized protein n=1 Tax=Boletus reticuloceps TaxID=495285 RepID=A0A8I2YIM4_9AGAM|nr:hypothetical protein JVT61DRAFT_7862 [Boletus reticuloceps]